VAIVRRRDFITLVGGAAAILPVAARAQPSDRVRRIGVLIQGSAQDSTVLLTFREELTKAGWVEGGNLQIDLRPSAGARLSEDAQALVSLRPELIFAYGGAAAQAARRATQIIPIVFVGGGDPVAVNGFAGGIARPTSNATGFGNNFASLGGKGLELLKAASPQISKVARVYDPELLLGAGRPAAGPINAAAAKLGITVIDTPLRNADEIERLSAFAAEPNGSLLLTGPQPTTSLEPVLRLAVQYRLPTMYVASKLVAEGLLMSIGPDIPELTRSAASYVDRILRGAKPSDLPIQYPTKFPLAINLKSAKLIGLDMPPTVLAVADEIIE
jgi:putative ABC transport system substrate-binding protein